MSDRTELQTLFAQTGGLECVSPLHRQHLVEATESAADTLVTEWRERVRLVEQFIEPLARDPQQGGQPHFHAVCRRLADVANPTGFCQRTGLSEPEEFGPLAWFEWAQEAGPRVDLSLFCLANFWLAPIPLESVSAELFADSTWFAAQPLRMLGACAHAAMLMEAFLQIDATHFADAPTLQHALDNGPLAEIGDPVTRSNTIQSLADALRFVDGRGDRHAAMLMEAFLQIDPRQFVDSPRMAGASADVRLALMQTWLNCCGDADDRTIDVCDSIAHFVRGVRSEHFTSAQQVHDFLHVVGSMADTMRRVARIWIDRALDANDSATADRMERQAAEWREQFVNRTLVDHLLSRFGFVATDGVAVRPQDCAEWPWPQQDAEPWQADRLKPWWMDDFRNGHRPLRQPQIAIPSSGLIGSYSLPLESRGVTENTIPRQPTSVSELTFEQTELLQELKEVANAAVNLPDCVPPGTVLLRATINDQSKAVRWTAWHHSDDLQVAARGCSSPGAAQRLNLLNIAFDMLVETVWACHCHPGQKLLKKAAHAKALQLLGDIVLNGGEFTLDDPQKFLENCQEAIAELAAFRDEDQSRGEFSVQIATSVGQFLLQQLGKGERVEDVPPEFAEIWRTVIQRCRNGWPTDAALAETTRQQLLNTATRLHVRAAARELNLTPLFAAENRIDWGTTDLLLQLEGPLWTLPISLFPVHGEDRLFERVASISNVVSLTLNRVAERQAKSVPEESRPNVLSAQWLDDSDRRCMAGLAHLHHGVQAACERHGCRLAGLGGSPLASLAHVHGTLTDRESAIRLAVLGGHGSEPPAGADQPSNCGVHLADGTFNGRGASLFGVDLLLVVACIVGRLRQSGHRDVRGMYADLAAAGARSIIAARWPIADAEAALFATMVTDEYLQRCGDTELRREPFARARALNEARKRCRRHVSDHLLAAFELYGRG